MSIKKYFEVAENIQSLSNKSAHEIASQVESAGYHEQDLIQEERFISRVDFSKPQNFARWGSAEEYYNEALKRIYEGYPYDGSLRERSEWHNESIDIDLYVFENRYPRTTGYVILSADGWGTGNLVDGYGVPATPEYIYVKGGPNPHQVKEAPYTIQFTGSNYYEPSKNRGSNLSLNLASNGASLEFWLKKSAFLEESPREVIFDLWNGENSSSADYARFRLELTGNLTDGSTPFLLTAMSGTTGFYRQNISSTSITSTSVGNDTWQHYAVTLKSASAGVTTRFYVNGALDKESTLGSTGINDVDSTALRAYVGALVTAVSGTTTPSSTKAADGKLSASLDEFRYWKTQRSSEEIGRFWFTQVGGGVNTDPVPFTTTEESSNVNLGVYFKFNEGITGRAATDSVVLDYSGRWSNGAWTGYTSNSRNTGSAIISSSAAVREFEDPIIYSFHPRVELLSTQLQLSGSTYDVNNNASLFKTIPSWISEEDEEGSGDVKKLTQILSSYFDSLHLKIESLNKLKDIRYLSGSAEKPLPFAEKLLSNYGLVAPDLFLDADILEKLLDRSEDKVYEKSLHDIKNIIYQNIYNNLNYIYKSKGTEKSFRNLIRCFGIDDELVKINMYANDVTYELQNNRRNVVVADKFVNFNNSDNTKATVYNYADPTNSNSVSYIDANSSLTGGFATTLETEVLFPLKISEDSPSYVNTNIISSSLFGVHGTTLSATKTTWPGDDTVNFQVYAVRDELYSDNVKFVLTSSTGGYIPKLSSSLYQQVYNNTRWNLAVRIKPETYPMKGLINSASSNYVVELHGIQAEAGVILEEFTVSASITAPRPSFVTGSKRVFVGAHRSNFTGSTVLDMTDVKVNACRYWLDYVDDEALRGHILDTENYGALQPHLYAFEFDTSASYGDVTKYDTLVFNWEFLTNTGSSAGGTFMVDDLSSGSADFTRFGSLGGILNKQYTASGSFFLPSSTKSIDKDFVISSKLNLPENVRAEDMVKVLNAQEQDVFTTESRPVNYYFAFEKSMYQVISEEILNSFANLKDFHNLIGDVVEQYRPEYKQLAFMRQKFFENVANQELDFEKFYEYYKWFDSSLSLMLGQLVPASADFSNNVRTMVENHVLERPKYRNKFPILQRKGGNDITGAVEGGGDGTAMGSPDDFPQGSLLFANTSLTKRQIGSSRTPQINSWKHFHAPIRETSLGPTKSLLFDESDDTNVTAGTAAQWQTDLADAYTNGVSVSFWFNISSFASGTEQVFNLGMIKTSYPYYQGIQMFLYDVATKPSVYVQVHTAGWSVSNSTNVRSSGLNLGTWYNVVLTIPAAAINGTGGDTPNMYINGGVDMPYSHADSVVNWTTMDLGARGVTIGAKPAGSGLSNNSFDGYMCDVAVWNKELTSAEVTEIYASGERTNLSLASCVGNLLSWWKLGSGTGDTYNGAMSNEVVGGPSGTPNAFASSAAIASVSPPAVSPYDPAAQHILDMAWRNKNIYWQRYRSGSAEPKPTVASNTVRKDLLTAIKKSYDRSVNTPVKFGAEGYVTFGGVARPPNNKPNYTFAHCSPYGPMVSGSNVPINIMVGFNEGVEELIDSPDEYYPTFKQRLGFGMNPTINIDEVDSTTAFDGNLYAPFSMYSSSVETGYNATVVTTYKSGTMLTNLHNDFVDSHDTPAQGPFTEKFVGGRFFRHTEPNAGSDTRTTRAEGFRLELGTIAPGKAGALGVVPPNYPFSDTLESELTNDAGTVLGWLKDVPIAQRFRDETAKRPLNIKNILMTTASVGTRLSGTITHNPIGNYQKNYQVISTGGRMINDPFFQDQSFDFALTPQLPISRLTSTRVVNTKAISIDGGDYYTFSAPSAMNTNTAETWSFWLNCQDITNGGNLLVAGAAGAGSYISILTAAAGSKLKFVADFSTDDGDWRTDSAVTTGDVWVHIAITYDGSSTSNDPVIYVNGERVAITELTTPVGTRVAWSGSPTLGYNKSSGFEGYVSDAAFYNNILLPVQVSAIYGNGTLDLINSGPSPENLIMWWRCGDGATDTAATIVDQKGNANLTAGGSPTLVDITPADCFRATAPLGPLNSVARNAFALPDRAGSNSNQTIIVNHFSAPGEYKTLSRGYLDPAHEELSAYNASPYRNRGVIDYGLSGSASADPSIAGSIRVVDQLGKNRGLNQLSTLHSDPYGIDSAYGVVTKPSAGTPGTTRIDGGGGYSITPSWTKTNRNRRRRMENTALQTAMAEGNVTGSVYDNLYVQHAIPQSEAQYAWVTASMAYGTSIFGLDTPTCTSASTMSQLLTASIGYVGGDFVGLRGKIIDNVNLTTHTLGFESPAITPFNYVSSATPNVGGSGSYVALGQSGDFEDWNDLIGGGHPSTINPITISMWIYPRGDNPDGSGRLFQFGDGSQRRLSWDNTSTSQISWRFLYGGGSTFVIRTPPGSVPLKVWTHVVATFGGGTAGDLKVYLNGLLSSGDSYYAKAVDAPTAGSPPILFNRITGIIAGGASYQAYDRGFYGNFANTAIWNRELNAEEVEALYNNGGRIELTNVASMRKNLLAWYRFNSDYGDSTATADTSTTATMRNQAVWDVYGSNPKIPVAATLATSYGTTVLTSSVILTDNKLTSGSSGDMGLSSSAYSNAYINSNVWWEAPTFVNEHDYLNALILNRGGPYGNPTWKQIRGMDRPVVRKMRENNLIGVAIDPVPFTNSVGTAQHPTRPNTFVDYYESPVENSKNPIYFYFEDNTTNSDSANNLIVTTPYGNELEHFSHAGLNTRLGLKVDLTQLDAYRSVKNFTMDSALSVLIKYSERIYPSTKNAYRKNIRGRTEYNIDNIWNNNREYRSIPLGSLSGAFVYSGSLGGAYSNIGVPTASIWPLDAHLDFATTGSALGTDGAGQLLNLYSRYSCSVVSDGTKRTNINAAPTYAYRTQYGWAASATGSGGQDPLYMGDAPWTAAETFGKPPYETYQSYADRIRSIGKDYSILPEFRISPLMSTYVDTHESNFLADLNNIFELTGAAVSSSVEDKFYTTYTNSDFLKYFKIVDDDLYEKRSGALKIIRDKVTLSCDALIKFLPYKGFYPAERTAELATIFSQSYGPNIIPAMTDYEANQNQVFRIVTEPLFSPGILHNTVKSGLAVSNFVLTYGGTGSNHTSNGPPMALTIPTATTGGVWTTAGQRTADHQCTVGIPTRDMLYAPQPNAETPAGQYCMQTVPFEALYDPESFFNVDTIANLSGSTPRTSNPGVNSFPNGVIYDTAATGSLAYLNPGTKKQVGVDLSTFQGSPTYKLAIDNFLSEVSSLFVDQFAHFKSDREENFKSVSSDNVYMMTLELYRTKLPGNETTMAQPDHKNFTMYNNPLGFGQVALNDSLSAYGGSSAHVTPPYYGAPATVTFKYTPGSGVTVPTIDEIFANTTVTYYRQSLYSTLSINTDTYYSRMQVSSSWNLFERLTEVPPGTVTQKSRWLLQSKMETPVLNFAHTAMVPAQSASSAPFGDVVNAATHNYGGASPGIRGMWHQYGSIPTGSAEGVFAIINPYPTLGSAVEAPTGGTPTGSLANILGFQAGVPLRIGSTTKEAKFEEAVVAVPYRVNSNVREFIKFPRITPSLVTLRAAMDKYVFPPKFDFTRFDTVETIMMYVFEFSADLTQTDIANMWQNLPPSIATEFKTQNAVVEEKELIDSIISKDKDIEWMVFKVKKRARSDFELVRRSQVTNDLTSLQPRITTPYSYNWPYDYFSLVELAKITEGVDYISADLKAGANISELESLDVDRTVISADFGAASYGAAYTGGGGSGGPQGAASSDVAQQSAPRNNYGPGSSGKPPPQSTYPGSSTIPSSKGAAQSVFNVASSGKGAAQSTYPGSSTIPSSKGAAQSTYPASNPYAPASSKPSIPQQSQHAAGPATYLPASSKGSSGVSSQGASYGGATNYGSSYEGGGSQAPPPTQYPPPGSF